MTTPIQSKDVIANAPKVEAKPVGAPLMSARVTETRPADAIKAAVAATVAQTEPKVAVAAPKAPRKPRTLKAKTVAAEPVVTARAVKAPKAAKSPKAATIAKTVKAAKTPKAAKTAAAKPATSASWNAATDFPDILQAQFKKIQESWMSGAADFGDLKLANTEIQQVVEATRDATLKGVNELKAEIEKFFQESINGNVASGKEMMKVKSLPQLLELQSKHAQSSLQAFVEHSRALAAIANRTTQEAFHPLSSGWTDAFSEFRKRASF